MGLTTHYLQILLSFWHSRKPHWDHCMMLAPMGSLASMSLRTEAHLSLCIDSRTGSQLGGIKQILSDHYSSTASSSKIFYYQLTAHHSTVTQRLMTRGVTNSISHLCILGDALTEMHHRIWKRNLDNTWKKIHHLCIPLYWTYNSPNGVSWKRLVLWL